MNIIIKDIDMNLANELKGGKSISLSLSHSEKGSVVFKLGEQEYNGELAMSPLDLVLTKYTPVCPYGYFDCIHDPAYILYNYPEWYKDLYGDKTPEEAAAEKCAALHTEDPEWCSDYDDEDK